MKEEEKKKKSEESQKVRDLERNKEDGTNQFLTSNQGVRIHDNQNTLSAGERGPSLLEDFIFREKMTHFDHERIPERIVHPRGSGAHGYFQVYESMEKYTKADFLQDPAKKTPVFVRFSTVVGFKGSTDLARDVRGFATKFYTEEGNYDLVGNNMPVFFIQDAMKFPDLVHAIKPEPNNEMPQASAAHDTFWDFVSLMPESLHTVIWAMSDRAIPRSFRMMEGFGVHTFKFINKQGKATFVKFHWKPVLGVHGVVWDEAQKISGYNPDFHRKDLWTAIEDGNYPEFELGVQLIPEEDEHKFSFDLLDPTKLVPEEEVPVKIIGKMVLNRNPDNFFAETEQVAFHPGHIIPGIDFTNDPLLQGRLFSYLDTQLKRLGGPNFHEIPINRPVAPTHNNQRDGHMRQEINKGRTSYDPNSLGGGCPFQAKVSEGGFVSHTQRVEGNKIRHRSKSFSDHFSQVKMFYDSQTPVEKKHIIDAFSFELGKVKTVQIRERLVGLLTQVDMELAENVAKNLGVDFPREPEKPMNKGVPADSKDKYESTFVEQNTKSSKALSMQKNLVHFVKSKKVAFLCAEGSDEESVVAMKKDLENEGAKVDVIAPHSGTLKLSGNKEVKINNSFITTASVLYDAIYLPAGEKAVTELRDIPEAIFFLNEVFKHCKPIAMAGKPEDSIITETYFWKKIKDQDLSELGLVVNEKDDFRQLSQKFLNAIKKSRFWAREESPDIQA